MQADLPHRHHAVIETVLADLIDGPLAPLRSGRFPSNYTWVLRAMITHHLLRADGPWVLPIPEHLNPPLPYRV